MASATPDTATARTSTDGYVDFCFRVQDGGPGLIFFFTSVERNR